MTATPRIEQRLRVCAGITRRRPAAPWQLCRNIEAKISDCGSRRLAQHVLGDPAVIDERQAEHEARDLDGAKEDRRPVGDIRQLEMHVDLPFEDPAEGDVALEDAQPEIGGRLGADQQLRSRRIGSEAPRAALQQPGNDVRPVGKRPRDSPGCTP